jgi:ABC-type cobalamin transport system permease subunit
MCNRAIDSKALSPFDLTNLFVDLIIALVGGTVVAVLAIGIGFVGYRYSRLTSLTDRRILLAIAGFYAIVTGYQFVSFPVESGMCRFDL